MIYVLAELNKTQDRFFRVGLGVVHMDVELIWPIQSFSARRA
jgi:hypothetical protein